MWIRRQCSASMDHHKADQLVKYPGFLMLCTLPRLDVVRPSIQERMRQCSGSVDHHKADQQCSKAQGTEKYPQMKNPGIKFPAGGISNNCFESQKLSKLCLKMFWANKWVKSKKGFLLMPPRAYVVDILSLKEYSNFLDVV